MKRLSSHFVDIIGRFLEPFAMNERTVSKPTGGDMKETSVDPKKDALISERGSEHHNATQDFEAGNTHLVELEVDFNRVLVKQEDEGDYAADTSPFPAVRGVVPETDDPGIPVNTLRAWILGIVSINRRQVIQSSADQAIRYSYFLAQE